MAFARSARSRSVGHILVDSVNVGTASALGSILIVAASIPLFLTYRLLGERATLRV